MGNNWRVVKLGEVTEIISGRNQKEVENPDGKYPIYGSGGVFGYANEYLCPPGTTVIGRKGTINNPIFVNEKFWNVDTAFGIHPFDEVLPKYLFYFCKGFNFKKLDKSTTIPSLAKRDLLQIDFPLIPLPEQRAIVARIEELFSELDHSIANLKSAKAKLEVYRQAVLKKAFEGGYTSKLKEGNNSNLPNDWSWKSIKEISTILGDGLHGTPKYNEKGDYHFINGNNLNDRKIEIKANTKRVDKIEFEKYKKPLNERTVFVSINGTLGNTAFYNNEKVILGKSACYFNLIESVSKEYILYVLKTNRFLNYANTEATGSTIKNVSLKSMRSFLIPLPNSYNEQTQIVQEIESRLSVADKLAETIQTNLEKAEALRQSILKKAFEGKLLSKAEIEACRHEADWEPAERLLNKIKSAQNKPKKS